MCTTQLNSKIRVLYQQDKSTPGGLCFFTFKNLSLRLKQFINNIYNTMLLLYNHWGSNFLLNKHPFAIRIVYIRITMFYLSIEVVLFMTLIYDWWNCLCSAVTDIRVKDSRTSFRQVIITISLLSSNLNILIQHHIVNFDLFFFIILLSISCMISSTDLYWIHEKLKSKRV